ncbi:MAG: patatin-like phospholipase family protein [Bacteroidota bacterium]
MKEFLENDEFQKLLQAADAIAASKKKFSDIEDARGNQYVDLVQEGGGVLGIALVGYTAILERAGIRFFSLAGTSAGAINTMMIAALGPIEQPKSEKILDILSRKNLFDLVDGNYPVRKLVRKSIKEEGGIGWLILLNIRRLYRALTQKLGLNPGTDFEKWITSELRKEGIKTMRDVNSLRQKLPEGLRHTGGGSVDDLKPQLAIIAADITTHSKIEFPRMSELFYAEPDSVPPAALVRTSMSIPVFFEPVTINNIPNAGVANDKKWEEHCKYYGPVPPSVRFVDGGLLSNFPINVFHRRDGGVPRKPTFGVRLSTYRETYSDVKGLKVMLGAMISSMRQIYDYDFLKRNPDFSQLICHVNADKDFNWLDFEIGKAEQVKMFVHGAREAVKFLEAFDWDKYKETRKSLADVVK